MCKCEREERRISDTHKQFDAAGHCYGYDVVRGPGDVVGADRPGPEVECLEHGRIARESTQSRVSLSSE